MSEKLDEFAIFFRKFMSGLGLLASVAIAILAVSNLDIFSASSSIPDYAVVLAAASTAIGPYIVFALITLNVDLHILDLSRNPIASSYKAAVLLATYSAVGMIYLNLKDFVGKTGILHLLF